MDILQTDRDSNADQNETEKLNHDVVGQRDVLRSRTNNIRSDLSVRIERY
jgi:hypothetical protein